MSERDSRPKPAQVEGGRQIPEEIPDDVRAELDAEAKKAAGAPSPVMKAEPVPEDVLAELDAEARADPRAEVDPDRRPIALDEDTER